MTPALSAVSSVRAVLCLSSGGAYEVLIVGYVNRIQDLCLPCKDAGYGALVGLCHPPQSVVAEVW